MLEDDNQIKGIRECLIKHFIFYYNSAYIVYKNIKYGASWWPQELELNYISAI
jgi:hypothetical protein